MISLSDVLVSACWNIPAVAALSSRHMMPTPGSPHKCRLLIVKFRENRDFPGSSHAKNPGLYPRHFQYCVTRLLFIRTQNAVFSFLRAGPSRPSRTRVPRGRLWPGVAQAPCTFPSLCGLVISAPHTCRSAANPGPVLWTLCWFSPRCAGNAP